MIEKELSTTPSNNSSLPSVATANNTSSSSSSSSSSSTSTPNVDQKEPVQQQQSIAPKIKVTDSNESQHEVVVSPDSSTIDTDQPKRQPSPTPSSSSSSPSLDNVNNNTANSSPVGANKINGDNSSDASTTSIQPQPNVTPKVLDYSKYFRDIDMSIRGDVSPKKSIQQITQLITTNSITLLNIVMQNGGGSGSVGSNVTTTTTTPSNQQQQQPPQQQIPSIPTNSELYQFLIHIPRYILSVLCVKNVTTDLTNTIIDFIKASIELAIDTINFDIPEMWSSINRILSPSHHFYKLDFGTKETKEHVALKKPQDITSNFYYSILLLLAERNLFDQIITLTATKPPLAKLKVILKTLVIIKDYLSPTFLTEYVHKVKDVVFVYFLELFFEDLSGSDKESFKEICHSIQQLLVTVVPQTEITTIFQEFDLNRALKCFQSPNLEKKLRGLRFIKKSAKWVNKDQGKGFGGLSNFLKKQKSKSNNKDDAMNSSTSGMTTNGGNGGQQQQQQQQQQSPPIDQQLLLNWVLKNEIVENFCKISDQPDIMTNGIPIMIFLCHSGKLENHHLELLWNSSIGKHESVKNIIYMSILELVGHLSIKQLDYFYEYFNKTINAFKAASDFDNELLNFIFNFSRISIQHQENQLTLKKCYGVDVFWRLIQDNDSQIADQYTQTLCTKSKSYLISLLKLQECIGLRTQYIDLAIENIKNNVSVVQSLSLIVNIVELFVSKKLRSVIESLEQKSKIFDIFFKEMATYKKNVTSKVKGTLHVTPINQTVFSGLFPHLYQIQARFDFLEFLLSQSSIMLNVQQVDIMWDAFVTHRLTEEEFEIFFTWLKNTRIAGRDRVAFPENVVKYLFVDKMSSLDWTSMTPTSYAVFERYFFYINDKSGKIKKATSLFGDSIFSINGNNNNNSNVNNNNLQQPLQQPPQSNQQSSTQPSSNQQQNGQQSKNSPSPLPSPMTSPNIQSTAPPSPQLSGLSNITSSIVPLATGSGNNDYVPGDYYIVSLDMIGINHIWSIALTSLNSEVSINAINTLNTLYQNGENTKSTKFKEEYFRVCMENISKSLETVKASSANDRRVSFSCQGNINRICRALHMVKMFINDQNKSGTSGNDQTTGPQFTRDQSQPISFLVKLDRGDAYIISDIAGTDTLRMLKRKVANIYGQPKPPVRSLKVYLGDKEMKDDDKCIDEYKIFDSTGAQQYQILVKRMIQQPSPTPPQKSDSKKKKEDKSSKNKQSDTDSKKDKDAQDDLSVQDDDDDIDVLDDTPVVSMVLESLQHQLGGIGLIGDVSLRKVQEPKSRITNGKTKIDQPSSSILISKPSNFEQIFNLLDFDNEIAEYAWNVLSDLPINPKILSDIKCLKEDISYLIPTNAGIYKTIYYLRVLDSVFSDNNSQSTTTSLGSDSRSYDPNGPLSQDEFKNRFIRSRGINYLVQIVVDTPIQSQKGNLKLFYLLLKNIFTIALINTNEKSNYGMSKYTFRGETSYVLEAPHFITKVHQLVSSVSKYQSLNESVDFNMVCQYGMEILAVSMKSAPKNLETNPNNTNNDWNEWIKALLLECVDPLIQTKASNLILNLTIGNDAHHQPTSAQNGNGNSLTSPAASLTGGGIKQDSIDRSLFFLSKMLSFLPTINQYYHTAEQYFCLLSELLNIGYPTSSPSPSPKPNHHKNNSVDNTPTNQNHSDDHSSVSTSSGDDSGSVDSSTLKVPQTHGDRNESLNFVKSLLSKLITELINMPIREISSTQRKDHILVGIVNVIRNLVRRRPSLKILCKEKNLIQILFKNCLFKTPTAHDHVQGNGVAMPPLCKTKESRLACFRLLRDLSKNDPNNFFLVERLITEEIDRVDPNGDWNYSPVDKEKTLYNYVGLKNQGATCYMNSLLQQLYHSTGLKQSLLSLSVPKPNLLNSSPKMNDQRSLGSDELSITSPPTSPSPLPANKDQQQQQQLKELKEQQQKESQQLQQYHMLNQIQLLFIYLQESTKRYYDPISFCKSIVNYDGSPINLGIQMDAYEFFHLFLDKLEAALKDITPGSKVLLKDSFGGVLTNQFIPKNCSHRSHCEEPFYSISLEVKNKKSLLESLELFIQEESLKDYKCEHCNDRVEITKRCLVDKLPNSLILHLKRFEYDLENMRNIKLNEFCEFPLQLNMAPYTKEVVEMRENGSSDYFTMDQSDYVYDLSGIVLHAGTADSGHYITLVKDVYGNWFELNDTYVQPYDFRRMQSDCFGGYDEVKEFDKVQQKYVLVRRPKICNAYMLFYNKTSPPTQNAVGHHRTASLPSNISKDILDTVWNENRAFILEKYLYDLDFGTFVWDIVNLYHNPTFDQIIPYPAAYNTLNEYDAILSSLKLATKYFIEIYSHSKEKGLIEVWAYHLKRLMRDSQQGTEWFLRFIVENRTILKSILLGCYFEKTRHVFVDIISFAVTLRKNTEENKNIRIPSIVSLMNSLIELCKLFKDYPRRTFQQLFVLLLNITQSPMDKEREYLLQRGIISKLIESFIGSFPVPTYGSSTSTTTSSATNNNGNNTGSSSSNNSGASIFSTNPLMGSMSNTSSGIGSSFSSGSSSGISPLMMENNKMVDFLSFLIRCCQPPLTATLIPSQLNSYPAEKDRTKPVLHIITDPNAIPTTSPFRIASTTNSQSMPSTSTSTSSTSTTTSSPTTCYIFSDTTLVSLFSKSFMVKIIKEYGWNENTKLLFKHLCWNNKLFSSNIFTITKEIILKSSTNAYPLILPMLTCLLEIQDTLAESRIETMMDSLMKLPDSMTYHTDGRDIFIRYLSSITGNTNNYYHTTRPITTEEFLNWKSKCKDKITKCLKEYYYR